MNSYALHPMSTKLINLSSVTLLLFLLLLTHPIQSIADNSFPIGTKTPVISEFWIVDTDEDTLVSKINDLDIINPSSLPKNFTVMANANTHTESVRFGLDDDFHYRVENASPYSLSGDNNGDYFPIDLELGWHLVRATPFGSDDATGSKGTEKTVRFALLSNKIVVDTPEDGHDAEVGEFCSTVHRESYKDTLTIPGAAKGTCTLRAAIEESNYRPGIQQIEIPNLGVDILLTLGRLEITESVFITGEEMPVINAQHSSSVMHVSDSTWVSLSGVVIANGDPGNGQGGGIYVRNSFLQLINTVVRDNRANMGGGLYLTENSHLLMQRSTLKYNTAGHPETFGGGGITQRGGGIRIQNSTARIEQSGLLGNRAVRGGGLSIMGSEIELINSSILENEAVDIGGGFEISDSNDNEARIDITFSTIARNVAGSSPKATIRAGGGFYNLSSGEVRLGNSILAENEIAIPTGTDSPDCYSPVDWGFITYRGNAIGVINSECTLKDSLGGDALSNQDQIGSENDPLDVGLLNNISENPVPYVGLSYSSVAVDKGNGVTSVSFFKCPDEDIREASRPVGEACDAGAYERQY